MRKCIVVFLLVFSPSLFAQEPSLSEIEQEVLTDWDQAEQWFADFNTSDLSTADKEYYAFLNLIRAAAAHKLMSIRP